MAGAVWLHFASALPRARLIFLALALLTAVAVSVFAVRARLRSNPAPVPQPSTGVAASTPEPSGSRQIVELIFDGKLAPGWEDWGFGRHDYADGRPVKVAFSGYGAIIFHHSELPSRFGGLLFRYKAPASFGSFLQVFLKFEQLGQDTFPRVDIGPAQVTELPDGWNEAWVPWSALNPTGSPFDRVVIRARVPVGSDLVSLNRVGLTEPSANRPAPTRARTARVSIDCKSPARRISPLIYGVADSAKRLGAPIVRIGGNTMSRLNWDLGNVWNTGNDWFFRNVSAPDSLPDWLAGAAKDGVQVAMVVPMIGWVAKDGSSVGFPVSRFGPQRAHDPEYAEAGDGVRRDGKPITPGPPSATSVPAPPELIGRWIGKLRQSDSARGSRSIHMYILDNEPMLWHVTHRDVHPHPVGYDELLERTIAYATAIRKADPDAVIAGPALWGWSAYFYSAKDLEGGGIVRRDQLAHGGVPLLPWYLQKLAAHEQRTGTRLLDVVDVHFYPQAPGIYSDKPGPPELIDLRIRSTRAWWDETYRDESWIGERVNLIPRLEKWIATSYPARGISIGEWSFGAEGHVSGALAITETLGRFGRLGLTSAFYWRAPAAGTPGAAAFHAFRNYDGKGARFLDWSLAASHPENLSLFASRNEAKSTLTAVALNLDAHSSADVHVQLVGCGELEKSRLFLYRNDPPRLAEAASGQAKLPALRLEPHSFGVVELSLRGAGARIP
jgi:hypothetical protein